MTISTPGAWAGNILGGNVFGVFSNQFAEDSASLAGIIAYSSCMYIKSDDFGTINLGHLSPASDNAAVLADISGTVIESNAVMFEGAGFTMRPKGAASGYNGIAPGLPIGGPGLTWATFGS